MFLLHIFKHGRNVENVLNQAMVKEETKNRYFHIIKQLFCKLKFQIPFKISYFSNAQRWEVTLRHFLKIRPILKKKSSNSWIFFLVCT